MKKIKKDVTTSIRFPKEVLEKARMLNLDIAEICRKELARVVNISERSINKSGS